MFCYPMLMSALLKTSQVVNRHGLVVKTDKKTGLITAGFKERSFMSNPLVSLTVPTIRHTEEGEAVALTLEERWMHLARMLVTFCGVETVGFLLDNPDLFPDPVKIIFDGAETDHGLREMLDALPGDRHYRVGLVKPGPPAVKFPPQYVMHTGGGWTWLHLVSSPGRLRGFHVYANTWGAIQSVADHPGLDGRMNASQCIELADDAGSWLAAEMASREDVEGLLDWLAGQIAGESFAAVVEAAVDAVRFEILTNS